MRTLPPLADDLDPAEVVAALAPVIGPKRAGRLDAIAAGRLAGVTVVLEDFRDPHNAGAALRSCEAMGLVAAHLVSVRQAFRTSTRITQGCERWLDVVRHADAASAVRTLRDGGFRLLAAVPESSHLIEDLDPAVPTALAFGNEHIGLSLELRERCDGEFAIPMHGASQSLNVSVSVAVALHVLTEARRRKLGRPGDLDEPALLRLRARYHFADLRGARAIIARHRRET